jgi:Ca-activated chloride channel family protein
VGVTDDNSLVKLITEKASEGVFLTVLGFGTGNLKDSKMEKLADNGNGMYAYIDSIREAHKVLVEQMSGSLVTIAKDVKIQIEFNPAEVRGYRLLGYENRMLKTQDFDNDKKDAGEIGAGHTVTAIYELVTVDKMSETGEVLAPKGLKYQSSKQPADTDDSLKTNANLSDAASTGELCTLALRYKQPDENTSKKIEFTIKNDEKSFLSASEDFRFASSVAAFGMILRGSKYSGKADPAMVQEIAVGAIGNDSSGYRAEFVDMVRRVNEICR